MTPSPLLKGGLFFNQVTNQPKEIASQKEEQVMGKNHHLNPILTTSRMRADGKARKINSNKLHDIKIPVSENLEQIIRKESRKCWGGSKTSLGTELLMFGLEHLFYYPDVEYQDGPFTVHIKVNHEIYQRIGEYQDQWRCRSIKQAAHRIFMEAVKKKQLGGITDESL